MVRRSLVFDVVENLIKSLRKQSLATVVELVIVIPSDFIRTYAS